MTETEAFLSITYFRPEFHHINKTRIHPTFDRLYRFLNWSEYSDTSYDNNIILSVTNVLNKFGFVLMSKDNIGKLDSQKTPISQVKIQYDLNNFITYTKSTLDAIAIVINEVYQMERSDGEIDLKWNRFYSDLIQMNARSSVAAKIQIKKNWIEEVVNWRNEINHRTFNVVGQLTDAEKLKDYTYKIAREPINIMDYSNYQYLYQKYGEKDFMQAVSTFCERWANNCSDFVETLGEELVKNIKLFKK